MISRAGGDDILRKYHLYRLAHHLDKPVLAGKLVVFMGYIERPGDVRRALVHLLNPDGSHGDGWLVWPSLVLRI